MASWHKLNVDNRTTGPGIQLNIYDQVVLFLTEAVAAGRDWKKIAVFTSCESGSQNTTLYFSPHCEILAKLHGEVPCSEPASRHVILLAGDTSARKALFGDTD